MKVKVENRSIVDFVGSFRDKPVLIKAGGFVEMGRSEAVKFLGEWSSIKVDGAGRHLMPKALYMVEDEEAKAKKYDQPLKYTAFDGTAFRTTVGLESYETRVKDEARESKNAKRRKTVTPQAAEAVS